MISRLYKLKFPVIDISGLHCPLWHPFSNKTTRVRCDTYEYLPNRGFFGKFTGIFTKKKEKNYKPMLSQSSAT